MELSTLILPSAYTCWRMSPMNWTKRSSRWSKCSKSRLQYLRIIWMLNILLSHSTVKIRTQEDPARLRPSDVPILWADASKFQRATGWEPRIPFEQTLRDLLDYWRDRVRRDTVRVGAVLNA